MKYRANDLIDQMELEQMAIEQIEIEEMSKHPPAKRSLLELKD